MRGLREIGYWRDYRPDVDGLRAIAVLCVLFFHAEVPGFGGGFVGVDLFFVISGFLITRNIYLDHRDGRWSFTEFYLRRESEKERYQKRRQQASSSSLP